MAEFSVPKAGEEGQSFLRVTLDFVVRSDMESLLKKYSITEKVSKALEELKVGPITSNIQKVDPSDFILKLKRNPVAPRGKFRSLKKDLDMVLESENF
jgi:hypothetical protein